MIRKNFKNGGFTLIELVIVLTILATIAGVSGGIISATLRATSKAQVLTNVRQNGTFAMGQIAKSIQYAQKFDGVSQDGSETPFPKTCNVTGLSPIPVQTKYKFIRVTTNETCVGTGCNQITFSCPQNNVVDGTIQSTVTNPASTGDLLDTTLVTLDSESCYFTCTRSFANASPVIGIYFTLIANQSLGTAIERTATIPFQTSVSLRNQE